MHATLSRAFFIYTRQLQTTIFRHRRAWGYCRGVITILLLAACKDTATTSTTAAATCAEDLTDCYAVEGGEYLVDVPADWNGEDALPALVYFHPYSGSADSSRAKSWMAEAAERGYLVIFPDGLSGTWSHVGSPSDARDELAFLDAVLADAAERWPLGPLHTAGFSQGGSMSWDAACYRGERFTTAFPIAGAFWEPLPATCSAPLHFRHTHGTADSVVPLEGRAIGDSQQGDVLEGIAVWRAVNGCAEEPDRTEEGASGSCQIWESCTSGRTVTLCLHGGGHEIPEGWLAESLDWVESLTDR